MSAGRLSLYLPVVNVFQEGDKCMAKLPKDEERPVPAWMVSFGDMITLLLTFFILLVALADTQVAGLVGAGQGPIIHHMMAAGKPGILPGRLVEHRQEEKRDMWWIPSQEGDPDQLEAVRQKLDEELVTRFTPEQASLHYRRDQLVLRLPARIEYDRDGRPRMTAAVNRVLDIVAEELAGDSTLHARINGDVPSLGPLEPELRDSMMHARIMYEGLRERGVPASRLSLWAWGASRPISDDRRGDTVNRGVTIDLIQTGGADNG